jgi:serine/threonine protein kinase
MNTRYKIREASAGEGGFGRIDKANNIILDRDVAVKVLDPLFKESSSLEDKERFKREAKTLASLSHPNIPAIYDVLFPETDDEFKLIFEWIDGMTVRRFIDEKGVMSLSQIKKWFANICSALAHALARPSPYSNSTPTGLGPFSGLPPGFTWGYSYSTPIGVGAPHGTKLGLKIIKFLNIIIF